MKGKALSFYLRIGAMIWFAVEARGVGTNYLDGVRDFNDLVQRVENQSSQSIRRNKDGAVEYIALGFARDENLVLISREPSIKEVNIIGTRAADTGYAALQTMTNLSSLSVCGGNSNGNTVELVSRLSQLRKLNLVGTILKPSDLPYLLRMTNLEELKMPVAWTLGSNAIPALTNLQHLRRLYLGGRDDSSAEETISYLRTNRYYVGTNWDGWRNPRASELTALTNLATLEELEIYNFSDFGDEQLRKFASFPNLKSLELNEIKVSGNWSNIVSQFPALTNAGVYMTRGSAVVGQKWERSSAGR